MTAPDSSAVPPKATTSRTKQEPPPSGRAVEAACPDANAAKTWSYLFVHHKRTTIVRDKVQTAFPVFIHTSLRYTRGDKHAAKEERPTISGLIFVQGAVSDIQNYLSRYFPGLFLVKDCSTGRTAVIPDETMRAFMQISQVAPTRIRFMPHSFDYYAKGNTLVRLTSGALAGLEGYRIRISRDKCLVTSLGGMTVAIGGIHKESFENPDEYVRQRREQLGTAETVGSTTLTPIQKAIDQCFITPRNQVDVLAVTGSAEPWLERAERALAEQDFTLAADIALFVLEEFGSRFRKLHESTSGTDLREADALCRKLVALLQQMLAQAAAPAELKENIESGLEALAIRFPSLPIELEGTQT